MSLLQGAKRGVRIVALPLATPAPRTTPTHKPSDHLTYYHFITPPPSANAANSWSTWVTGKAADLWAGLGKAPEGNWKRRAFLYGERLIDRLDFEELALKSFDTSLGPKLLAIGSHEKLKPQDHPTIPLIYPPSACTSPLPHLRALLEKRTPRHRKGCIMWIAIAPLTAPFMLIPIIPNFPFFFCAWRAWSHYQAFKASQYLQAFVDQGAIHPQPSAELDAIYSEYAPAPPDPEAPGSPHPGSPYENEKHPSSDSGLGSDLDSDASATPQSADSRAPSPSVSPSSSSPATATDTATPEAQKHADSNSNSSTASATRPHLLLTRAAVPALERLLEIPERSTFSADVYRALEQVRFRLDAGGR